MTKAEETHLECLHLRKEILGCEHPDTLSSMENLSSFYLDQKKYFASETLLLQVIQIKQSKYTLSDPKTLSSVRKLAKSYKIQGKHAILTAAC